MPTSLNYYSALIAIKKVLAADFACHESDFEGEGVFIHQAKEIPGRRRFPFREKPFAVATMGRGAIISCSVERLGWCDANLSRLSRNEMFGAPAIAKMNKFVGRDGQYIVGPDLKFICAPEIFRPYKPEKDIRISLVTGPALLDLYKDNRFPNSLGPYPIPLLPMAVAAVARCAGEIAGIAAVCIESDSIWQVGVDTLEPYRQRGVGKATVSAVTEVVLAADRIPYYSSLESNDASRQLAASLGYQTAWIELYAREKKA